MLRSSMHSLGPRKRVYTPHSPACRRGVVAALHQMGMHCVLLTGDNWRTARAIGEQVGVLSRSAAAFDPGRSGCASLLLRGAHWHGPGLSVMCVALPPLLLRGASFPFSS